MGLDNDKLLIQRVLEGDQSAFRELFQNYRKLVNHIVYKMIPNITEREDICQDVFVKVYQNLGGFHFNAKLSTWIGRIAYNRCLTFLEKKKAVLYEDISAENETIDNIPSSLMNPEKVVEQIDLSERIRNEIDSLPMQYKTIITLYHLDELKYDEIAKIMKLPEGTVKSYLFRGRKLLKDRLMLKYEDGDL